MEQMPLICPRPAAAQAAALGGRAGEKKMKTAEAAIPTSAAIPQLTARELEQACTTSA